MLFNNQNNQGCQRLAIVVLLNYIYRIENFGKIFSRKQQGLTDNKNIMSIKVNLKKTKMFDNLSAQILKLIILPLVNFVLFRDTVMP